VPLPDAKACTGGVLADHGAVSTRSSKESGDHRKSSLGEGRKVCSYELVISVCVRHSIMTVPDPDLRKKANGTEFQIKLEKERNTKNGGGKERRCLGGESVKEEESRLRAVMGGSPACPDKGRVAVTERIIKKKKEIPEIGNESDGGAERLRNLVRGRRRRMFLKTKQGWPGAQKDEGTGA